MNIGTEAIDLQSFLEGKCLVRISGPVPEPDLDDISVILTTRYTYVLVRGQEIHEFPTRDELAHFLWAECEKRVDSLILLYDMKLLRVATGPILACRGKSIGVNEAPAA